jgi:tRNA 2-thiouridine synthesizing protein A
LYRHEEKIMPGQTNSDVKLNLEGLLCPIPIVKVSQAVKNMKVGDVLEATATDPGVLADIPAWTKSTGNELLSIEKDGKLIRFHIKRTK